MGCFQASLVLLVCFILTGCTSEQSPKEDSPTPLLEDLFDPGRISVFFGGQEYSGVGYELKPGVDPAYAMSEITRYLRNEPGCRGTVFSIPKGFVVDYDRLHPREYWAMVLADMNGIDLRIPAWGKVPHEKEITTLLERLSVTADRE